MDPATNDDTTQVVLAERMINNNKGRIQQPATGLPLREEELTLNFTYEEQP